MKKILAYGLVGGLLLLPFAAQAINPPAPHDSSKGVTCDGCHVSHRDKAGMTGSDYYNNICLSCHRPGDAIGAGKPLALGDAANPSQFKGYTTATPKPRYQTSHRWTGFLSSSSAGARVPQGIDLNAKINLTGNQLACIVCHNQHDNTYGKFLRGANDSDQLCRDCHAERDKNTHIGGSHPVMVNYSATAAAKPGLYRKTPLNANPANASSAMQLKSNQVVCSTCHGLHYSDSRSSTVDAAANFANLSTGDGTLLRTDLKGTGINTSAGDALNICSNCHANKFTHNGKNQNIQCTDCHGAHVNSSKYPTASNNVFLVRREMAAAANMTLFTSINRRNYADPNGTGVCQSCHEIPTGVGYPDEHRDFSGCTSCHSHSTALAAGGSFGLKGGCTSCHGYPPLASVQGGPDGYAAGSPFTAEGTGGHFAHADRQQYAKRCVECHKGNVHNSGTFSDVFNAAGPLLANFTSTANGGLKPAYTASTLTCANVYCHSNGKPRGGTLTPVVTPSWDPAKGGGLGSIMQKADRCDSCHQGYKSTQTSNSHPKHLATAATCATCHDKSPADNSFAPYSGHKHVNGQKDVIFSGTVASGTWDTSAGTCANLYCHSNGQADSANVTVTTPAWDARGTTCTSCHGDRNSTTGKLSNAHYAHLNFSSNVGRPLHCNACHSATAGSDTTIANPLNHANSKANIRFDQRFNPDSTNPAYGGTPTTAADGAAVNTSASGASCTNTYCHSGGAINNLNSPTWGSGTNLSCSGCHGNGTTKSHPIYVGVNSHIEHVEKAGYGCNYCHVKTVADSSTMPQKVLYQPYSTHINRKVDVDFKVNGGATGSFNPTTHSCSATYCHGSNSPVWGTAAGLGCTGCHGANSATLPGAHGIHYASTTVPVKFRNLSGNVSTTGAYRFTCSTCHDPAAATHAGGPANLSPVGAAEVKFAPLATKTGTVAYTYGASQGAPDDQGKQWTTGGAASCNTTYCHSNGQGGNGVAVDWSTTTSSGSCAKCHADATSAASLSGRHATHLGSTMAVNFNCATCHGNTASSNTAISNKANHVNQVKDVVFGRYSGSFTSSNCYNTYCHSNGTTTGTPQHAALSWSGSIAGNCAGCHGNATSAGRDGSSLSGKHRAHINNYTTLGRGNNFGCSDCHAKTVSNNSTISDRTRHINQLKDYSSARAGRMVAAGQCASNYCHSSGQATPVYRNMTGSKRWTGSANLGCKSCHGADSNFVSAVGEPNHANGPAGTATANSHQKHVAAIGIVDTTQCADCHAKTVDAAIANKFKDYTGASYHINKQRDVVFQPVGAITGNYDTVNRTCSATYCHGTPATLPQWGGTGLSCGSCHLADRTKAGAHYIHYDSLTQPSVYINFSGNVSTAANYRFTCSSCHASGAGKAQHARGPANPNGVAQVFFSWTASATQPYNYGTPQTPENITFTWTSGGSSSCNTNYCHSNGQSGANYVAGTAVNWGMTTSGASCEKCHPIAGLTNKHNRHISAAEYGFGCTTCHSATVSNNSTISDKSKHVNKVKDVAINATYGGTYNGSVCANTYCHSDGQATASYVTNQAWSGTVNCTSCHGNATANGGAGTPLSGAHASHVNNSAIIGTNFACVDCHAKTVSNNTTIGTRANHVNKFVDISGSRIRTMSTIQVSNGTCTSYCHTNGRGGAPNSALNWSSAAINCSGCHSIGTMSSGGHAKHISAITDCARCHRLTTASGTSIVASTTTHLNAIKDVRFATFAGYTGSFNGSTCSVTYCHGSATVSPAWVGGTTTCSTCHGTVGATPLPGGHAIHAGTTAPTSYTAAPAINGSAGTYGFTCSSCHLAGTGLAQHANGPAGAFGDAQVYFGYTTATRKGTYTAGATATTDSRGFRWTTDGSGCATTYCHSDGKGGNGSAAISWTTAVPSGDSCEKCHTLAGTAGLLATKHNRHISAAEYGFGCATCHSATVSNNSTISDKTKHVNRVKDVAISATYGGTYSGGSCQNVYCHSNAAPAGGTNVFRTPVWTSNVGCTGCHTQSSGVPGDANLSYGHNRHIALSITCDRCHVKSVNDSGGVVPGGLHVNKVKDVRFGHFSSARSFANISGVYNSTARTCANTYCHSDGPTSTIKTAIAFAATAAWGGSTTCISCHGYNTTIGGAGTFLTGAHFAHTASANYGYSCTRCHAQTTTTGSSITGFSLHVNGDMDIDPSVSTISGPVLRGTYANSKCENVYCHSNGQSLYNPADAKTSFSWYAVSGSSYDCSGCHNYSSAPNSGSHTVHMGLPSANCRNCHNKTDTGSFTVDKSVHADQNITIQFSAQASGTYNGNSAGGTNFYQKPVTAIPTPASCSNISCHANVYGTGTITTPAWGNGTDCVACHTVAITTSGPATGSHAKHNNANCALCHAGATNNTTTPTVNHADGNIDVINGYPTNVAKHAAGTYTGTCSTASCHSNVYGTGTTITPVWGTTAGCNSCHNGAGAFIAYSTPSTQSGPNTGSHSAHMNYNRYVCDECHAGAVSGTSGGAAHADGNIDVTNQGYPANVTKHTAGSGYSTCTLACHITTTWGTINLGCINCHASPVTRTKGRPGTQLAAVTTEFGFAYGHKKTGRGAVADADCIVCHLEGNYATQKTSRYHADGNIDLRDPDGTGEAAITNISNANWTFQRFSTSYAAGTRTSAGHTSDTDIANVITQKFCLACHDTNGATNTTSRAGSSPSATAPFGGGNLRLDAKAQFATTNSSRHPVMGPRTADYPTAIRLADPYKPTGTRGTSGTTTAGVVMNCFDCHNTGTTSGMKTLRTISAHGDNNVLIRGGGASNGTIYVAQPTHCASCHLSYNTYPGHNTGTSGSAFGTSNGNMNDSVFLNCHYCHADADTGTRPARSANFHGVNALSGGTTTGRWSGASTGTPAQVNAKPYGFIRHTTRMSNHQPREIGGSTYSPQCTMSGCNDQGAYTYSPGGTYP